MKKSLKLRAVLPIVGAVALSNCASEPKRVKLAPFPDIEVCYFEAGTESGAACSRRSKAEQRFVPISKLVGYACKSPDDEAELMKYFWASILTAGGTP